jgi:hypothetical protein
MRTKTITFILQQSGATRKGKAPSGGVLTKPLACPRGTREPREASCSGRLARERAVDSFLSQRRRGRQEGEGSLAQSAETTGGADAGSRRGGGRHDERCRGRLARGVVSGPRRGLVTSHTLPALREYNVFPQRIPSLKYSLLTHSRAESIRRGGSLNPSFDIQK